MPDFFISYTSADRSWEDWIAWELTAAGYTSIHQAWDFRPGANFVTEMRKALEQCRRTIAVYSPNYFNSTLGSGSLID
jgi:TIR domain